MMCLWRSFILLIPICIGWVHTAQALDVSEGYSFTFEDTPLIHALSELAQESNLDLSFNPDIIPDTRVSESFEDERATHVLYSLLDSHRLSTYIMPNGVFVIYKSLRRELPYVPEIKFDPVEYGPLNGTIYVANGNPSVMLRSIGTTSVAKFVEQTGSVTIPVFNKHQIIYITASGAAPVRLSPFELNDNFEVVLEMLRPPKHPYPAIQ